MERSPNKFRWLTGVVAPLGVLTLGVVVYAALTAKKPPRFVALPEATPVVETLEVMRHTAGLDLEVDGIVVPFRDVELSAEVSGRIVKKADACRAGQFVAAGTVLFEIDPADYAL